MKINDAGLQIIKDSEGLRLTGYTCPAGVATIGWGHTGADVNVGARITEAQAEAMLKQDLAKFERGVLLYLDGAPTSENQFSAFVSLAFNIGLGAFMKSSALRHHKAGHRGMAANSILLWVRGGGKALPGLVKRRARERKLYLS